MNDVEVAFSGRITWGRFFRAQLRHTKRQWVIWLLFPMVMTVSSPWWLGYSPSGPEYLEIFFTFLWILPVMIGTLLFHWWRMYSRTPYFKTPISGTISPAGVTASGPAGRSETPWSAVVRTRDAGDVLMLYTSPYQMHLLYRDFFASEQDWQTAKWYATTKGGDLEAPTADKEAT